MLPFAGGFDPMGNDTIKKLSPLAGALILAGLAVPGLRAEGVVKDSLGPITGGRGGTHIAHSDNLILLNDNPAGLASLDGLRFEADLDVLKTEINYHNSLNDEDAVGRVWSMPTVLASYRLFNSPRPVTVGLGVFLPAGFGAHYRLENPVFGRQNYFS